MINVKGQSILEYTIVLGVIVIVIIAMGPMIKRGTQALIKVVADQVGTQEQAEQKFDEAGHLIFSHTNTYSASSKEIHEVSGATKIIYDDLMSSTTSSVSNSGLSE